MATGVGHRCKPHEMTPPPPIFLVNILESADAETAFRKYLIQEYLQLNI
jgi:hypothetical protein